MLFSIILSICTFPLHTKGANACMIGNDTLYYYATERGINYELLKSDSVIAGTYKNHTFKPHWKGNRKEYELEN